MGYPVWNDARKTYYRMVSALFHFPLKDSLQGFLGWNMRWLSHKSDGSCDLSLGTTLNTPYYNSKRSISFIVPPELCMGITHAMQQKGIGLLITPQKIGVTP